jgi:aminoglycoside phosphotransferase (APT) family kinase protein
MSTWPSDNRQPRPAKLVAVTGPPAEGVRVAWGDLPGPVRAAIEEICGSAVVKARTQPGGFSPGVAARVVCADGTRHFVKAVSREANPDSPGLHRQEGDVLAALDAVIAVRRLPIPRLRGTVDRDPWIALVLEDVDGRHPAQPWRPGEIERVLAALDHLAEALTPAPIAVPTVGERFADAFTGWRTLARSPRHDGLDRWTLAHLGELAALEATWTAHAAGDTLLHTDVRADNLLLTPDRVVVVDWPQACRGAAFIDPVFLALSVAMQGGPGLADMLALSRAGRTADRQDLAATVCAVAGYLTQRSLEPAPAGLPTVRAFQAAQGAVARRWLAELL